MSRTLACASSLTFAVLLAAAPPFALAQDEGAIVGWGDPVIVPQSELTDLVAVSCGSWHNLALRADGSVVAWGANEGGQSIVPAHDRPFVAVAAGSRQSFAILGRARHCLALDVENLVAGQNARIAIRGGPPGRRAVTIYGFQHGETNINHGLADFCARFGIHGVNQSRVIGGFDRFFDANGEIVFEVAVPPGSAGRTLLFQAALQGECPATCVSNLVEEVVR